METLSNEFSDVMIDGIMIFYDIVQLQRVYEEHGGAYDTREGTRQIIVG